MRDIPAGVGEEWLEKNAAAVLRQERAEVVHVAQVRDPTVFGRVVRRHLARGEITRPSGHAVVAHRYN